eukprot:3878618-Prymnesium_polylepis.2
MAARAGAGEPVSRRVELHAGRDLRMDVPLYWSRGRFMVLRCNTHTHIGFGIEAPPAELPAQRRLHPYPELACVSARIPHMRTPASPTDRNSN